MVWQFNHCFAESKFWVNEEDVRAYLLGRTADVGQRLNFQEYRLVFRRQASSTNERTLVSTIIPPAVHADNLASVVIFTETGERLIRNTDQLFLCAIFNSLVLDYSVRQRVTTNLNFFYIYQLPVPRLGVGDRFFNDIVERAAKLICTTPEFDDLAQEVGLGSHEQGVTDEGDRAKLRAELDGMIAHLYGLTEEEFAYILTTFPVVSDSVKQAVIEAYHTFAPLSGDQEVVALIIQGESNELEFKVKANQDKSDKNTVVEGVAAFLNTAGGTLLIGVADDKSVVGLQQDYETLGRKKNRDGYKLFLTNLLLDRLGDDCGPLIQITFHEVEGKDVCRVTVQPSPRPVYVEEHLFIRADGSKRKLSAKEAVEYSKNRWK